MPRHHRWEYKACREWEKDWLFMAGTTFIRSSHEARLARLQRLVKAPTGVDRAFFAGLRWLMSVERVITRLYLFLRLRRRQVWHELVRKLKHLVNPRVRRAGNRILKDSGVEGGPW